jgi:hypothetical protein
MGIATFNRVEMHRRWQEFCRNTPKIDDDGSMVYFLVWTQFCLLIVQYGFLFIIEKWCFEFLWFN